MENISVVGIAILHRRSAHISHQNVYLVVDQKLIKIWCDLTQKPTQFEISLNATKFWFIFTNSIVGENFVRHACIHDEIEKLKKMGLITSFIMIRAYLGFLPQFQYLIGLKVTVDSRNSKIH